MPTLIALSCLATCHDRSKKPGHDWRERRENRYARRQRPPEKATGLMPINVNCEHCQHSYVLKDELQGKHFRCRECGEVTLATVQAEHEPRPVRERRPVRKQSSPSPDTSGRRRARSGARRSAPARPKKKPPTRRKRKPKPAPEPYDDDDGFYDTGDDYGYDEDPYRAPAPVRRPKKRKRQQQSYNSERRSSHGGSLSVMQVLFSFQGRIGQGTFIVASILSSLAVYALMVFCFMMTGEVVRGAVVQTQAGALFTIALVPLFLWIGLALQVKRWQDRNKSGVMILINLIPVVGPLWAFVELVLLPGTPGTNSYGPAP